MEGRERVMVMGKGGTAQRYWVLRMETAQNQSSSDNAPKHTSLHEKNICDEQHHHDTAPDSGLSFPRGYGDHL